MIIYGKEKEILKAQKRSLAAWINNTLGSTIVDADNLISKLSTGVILCKLAKYIQLKADEKLQNFKKSKPEFQLKYWEKAKRETFFARDNAELFIRWCKTFGVRDAVLFESDGLVLQTQPRTVILCLLELSRLAAKYGVLLPPPIQLPPATIAIDNCSDCSDDDFLYATTLPSPTTLIHNSPKSTRWDSGCSSDARSPSSSSMYSKTPSPTLKNRKDKNLIVVVRSKSDNFLDRKHGKNGSKKSSPRVSPRRSPSLVRTDTISSRLRSNSTLNRSTSSIASMKSSMNKASKKFSTSMMSLSQNKCSTLDKRVTEVARQYYTDEDKFHRLSEGHYVFGDKNVYVRIVRGNNVVVRVGGGWDTLEHFLAVNIHSKGRNCRKIGNPKRQTTKILV